MSTCKLSRHGWQSFQHSTYRLCLVLPLQSKELGDLSPCLVLLFLTRCTDCIYTRWGPITMQSHLIMIGIANAFCARILDTYKGHYVFQSPASFRSDRIEYTFLCNVWMSNNAYGSLKPWKHIFLISFSLWVMGTYMNTLFSAKVWTVLLISLDRFLYLYFFSALFALVWSGWGGAQLGKGDVTQFCAAIRI